MTNITQAEKAETEKNEVYMLEQQNTNEPEFLKPIPIVGKQDYSGAHEVCLPTRLPLPGKLLTST